MLHSRHKVIRICWIPSHIYIEGNERADQLAKLAVQSQDEVTYIHHPHKDYYPVIRKAIRQKGMSNISLINTFGWAYTFS